MAKIAYLDDNVLLGQSYALRNYDAVRQAVQQKEEVFTIKEDGKVYGFEIRRNEPLTQLYGFPCYVVKFVFSDVSTLHLVEQEQIMNRLCVALRQKMNETKGYYNIRVPSHIVDLMKAINANLQGLIHCGGTVEEIHVGDLKMPQIKEGLKLFFADESFVKQNKALLMDMAYQSFKIYQGQYHISPVTADKAGDIYSNWIGNYFDRFKPNTILIAEYENEVTGYCTISENEIAIDAVLSSVNEEKRRLGTYKAMIATLIRYAKEQGKLFVTSTQFDNYIVQGTWNSLGLRPFYSIYNMHYDNR